MRRPGLVLVTVGTVLLTGLTLVRAGWFEAGAEARPTTGAERTAFAADVPWSWRDCGPRHWHGCLLNP